MTLSWLKRIWLLAALLVVAGCSRPAVSARGAVTPRPTGGSTAAPVAAPSAPVPPGSETPGLVPQAGSEALALSDLHMVSAAEGWALAWTQDRSSGGIWRTADGGRDWQNVSPPALDPTQIETTFFLDAAHAWLIASAGVTPGTAPPDQAVTVLRTADGGRTWQPSAPVPFTSAAPGWLYFLDAQHGWLMANLGASAGSMAIGIYRTTDGGAHWGNVSLTAGDPALSTPGSLPLACNKTGLSFINPTTGWATGHCTTGGLFFYVTHDAGRTWQAQTLRPPGGAAANLFENCDCEATPPVFASAQNGVAPVKIFTTGHEAVLYFTQDAGRTWQASQLASNNLLRPPDFVSATDGWVTDEARIFRTRDGGRTWVPVAALPNLRLLGAFDFVDLQNGWVTGGEQAYRTSDGGRTWQPIEPMPAIGTPTPPATVGP